MPQLRSNFPVIKSLAYRADRLILLFHGLGSVPERTRASERDYWCERDRFLSILDAICSLPAEISIEITFDDGNLSDAVVALPALVDRGLKARFFVCAGRIGRSGYLDCAAMNELVSSGMEIGSHGWDHLRWPRVDDARLDVEIDDARKKIADCIGRPVDDVSIPFGIYNRRVLRRLRQSNIRTVFTSDGGRAPSSGWILPRETFRKTTWDDGILTESATCRFSAGAVRRSVVGLIKRLR